jgi:protein TonB
MLWWSAAFHVALLATFVMASRLGPKPTILPQGIAWVVPGVPGPTQGMGGGPAPTSPEPEPPKEEESEKPPRVVRPTKEQREQMPMPDAKTTTRKPTPPKPDSGLTGRDSASAASAQLKQTGPANQTPGLGLGGSGGSAFDQEFEYAYYVQQMLARISAGWQRVPVRGQAVVIVRFTILKNGSLQDIEVEQSSGLSVLDLAATRAVYLADPLPPLPDTYPRDRVGVHLRFQYTSNY